MSAINKTEVIGKPVVEKRVPTPSPAAKLPPLFRKIDWLAFGMAFIAIWFVFFHTLAPELTLEDSGELCTGSFYAGIPHPPGYPFWAIYSWFWTKFLPIGNIAWRVEVGESTAAAFACGLVALMVSRGSSMLMESIDELKNMTGKWESAICVVSGTISGILLGLGHTVWSESVAINRISLFGLPWVMTVLVCLWRWMYAPHQRRYLFLAMFFFGICATIHQTLLVAALGVVAGVAYAQPRLGRHFFLGISIIFLTVVIAYLTKLTAVLDMDFMLEFLFYSVGLAAMICYVWFAILTKETPIEFCLDGSFAALLLLPTLAVGEGANSLFVDVILIACLGAFIYFAWDTRNLGFEWLVIIVCGILWGLGAAFYFYEPISGMTNPPMEWGYPRTVEGFFHALSRGQYEKAHPTNIFAEPGRFFNELGFLVTGIADEFNWVLVFVTLIPFLFFFKMRRRERAWITCLTVTYFCIGVLLVILMSPGVDRSSVDLHRVFFASSHGVIAILFGYGLALTAAYMATNYQNFRIWGLIGGSIAGVLALYSLWENTGKFYFGIDGVVKPQELPHWIAKAFGANQDGMPIFGALILAGLALVFLAILFFYKERAPLALTLAIFSGMPFYSAFTNWGISEQRNHWFGYWFGHDMFTPPFKGKTGKPLYPEMTRDAVLFGGTDPGRFCPTYMIFCESFIPHQDQPLEDQHFDRRDVYIITQNALADPTYLDYIRAQYNRSAQVDPPFFQELIRSQKEKEQNYTTNIFARLAYEYLDKPLTAFGKRVEDRRRAEGVYPPKEIITPNAEDSSRSFNDYMQDAAQRLDHDRRFPNEPRQIKPGEDVHQSEGDNRVSVSGQVAVMSINGLLTKVIFDKNPTHEFFVEESFPLDWMYPYLSPFGVIMKINRQPLEEYSEDQVNTDHEFWSQYSDRTIGNWINYETSVKDVAAFVRKVYLQKDFNGFKGDRKFIRDDQAQKAFSKLRSSIGGIYDWRFTHPHSAIDQQRMLKEAQFAYLQSFAFCPYSPEAVYRYVQLLTRIGKFDDAAIVAKTCADLDPNNDQIQGLYKQLNDIVKSGAPSQGAGQFPQQRTIEQLQKDWDASPDNFQAAFNLASAYLQMQQKDKAIDVFDRVLKSPKADYQVVISVVNAYIQMQNMPKIESALARWTEVQPNSPEAWHELAAVKAMLNKPDESINDLKQSALLNQERRKRDPKAADVTANLAADPRFNSLHSMPEFQQLSGVKPFKQ